MKKIEPDESAHKPNRFNFGRFLLYLVTSLITLATTTLGAVWTVYDYIGRTPGELLDYVERRLEGHPRLEYAAHPVITAIRDWLHEPSLSEKLAVPFNVPPPPPLSYITKAETYAPPNKGSTRILRVAPQEAISSMAQAAKLAGDGDIVVIHAGEYIGDVTVWHPIWHQKKLTIRGIGGNARLFANRKSAEGKAIWVIRNGDFEISNINFIGARVADNNVAGIRFDFRPCFVMVT